MSLVVAIGNKNFIVFGCEQRSVTTNTINGEKTIQENYKKVFKINNDVILGFAGDADYCKIITKYLLDDSLSADDKLKLSYEDADEIIKSQFNSVVNQVEADTTKYRKAKAYVVVGGRSKGTLKISSYFYENTLNINKFQLMDENPKLITLSSGKYDHEKFFTNEFRKNPIATSENVKKFFTITIKNGVKYDTSINDKIIFEEIKR